MIKCDVFKNASITFSYSNVNPNVGLEGVKSFAFTKPTLAK